MWQRRFNNEMQSSLDRLNLGPRLAKNKRKWKETIKKSHQKRQMKSYTSGAKRYWMAWSVDHKEKRELLVSLPPRNVHILYVQQWNTKEMEVNSLLLKHCFASPRGKKRKKLLCIGSKLPWFKFVFLSLGNDKDYDNECLRKKNVIWDQCHFAFSTKSVRFRTKDPWRLCMVV